MEIKINKTSADDELLETATLANAGVDQLTTEAERSFADAGLLPAFVGVGNLPPQVAEETREDIGFSNSKQVQDKAVSGAKAMGLRTFVSLLLRATSSLTLSHFLFPKDYGLFGAAAGIAGLGQYFCDVGVGSVLVMQEREPTEDEVTTIFWLQQLVTAAVVLIILICIPLLLALFKAPPAATAVLVVMTLGLFPASLRVVPVMRLERSLNFGRQAKAEMIENFSQVSINLLLAFLHFGTWALVGGAITGRVVGLVAVWRISPWRPRGHFRMDLAKQFLGRGAQFQLNVLAPPLIASAYPIVISRILGLEALGLVNWAANLASVPLLLSSVLNRVALPAMSRLQSNPAEIGRVTSVLVRRVSTTLSLCFAPIVIVSPVFIPLIFGHRWLPAVPLFQWAIIDTINLIAVGLLATAVSIAGSLSLRLVASIVGGITKLVLLYVVLHFLGLNGVGLGGYIGTLIEMAVLGFYAHKHIDGCKKIAYDILLPLIGVQGGAALGLAVAFWLFGKPTTLQNGFFSAGVALVIFLVCVTLYDLLSQKQAVRSEVMGIIRMLRVRRTTA